MRADRAAEEEREAQAYAAWLARPDTDWRGLNRRIIQRWSLTALLRIKARAWAIAEGAARRERE